MIEGLLFNRIDAKARGSAVSREHNLVILPCPHETQAALALMELAIARADVALDATVLKGVPVTSRLACNRLIHVHVDLILGTQ